MELYSARTQDELGRFVLHNELRKELGFNAGDKVSLQLIDTIVILQRFDGGEGADFFVGQIDNLGMIELPAELRQRLGWKEKHKIALYHVDNLIILKSA